MSHLVRGAFLPNWVAVGEPACCSAGTLPDLAPQQNADGSCATYTVQPGDFCSLIASKNTVTIDDIENFNTETWGWQGCGDVQLGQVICLSSGTATHGSTFLAIPHAGPIVQRHLWTSGAWYGRA
jgi:hypothetical protein